MNNNNTLEFGVLLLLLFLSHLFFTSFAFVEMH